jgi:5-methylcytosine-specific restriction endonuclease McrA
LKENELFFNRHNIQYLFIFSRASDNFVGMKEMIQYLHRYYTNIYENECVSSSTSSTLPISTSASGDDMRGAGRARRSRTEEPEVIDLTEQKPKKRGRKSSVKPNEKKKKSTGEITNLSYKKMDISEDEKEENIETNKKPKKKSIPLAVKRVVWSKWIGADVARSVCTCCRITKIEQMSFHCGHIVSEANGGEIKIDNLKPICQSCNSSMGTMNMDEFIERYGLHS